MSETLPRTASAPNQADNLPSADELRARVYGPENKVPTADPYVDSLPYSSVGTRLRDRIAAAQAAQEPATSTYADSLPYLSIGSRLQDRLAAAQAAQESDTAGQMENLPAPEITLRSREISRAATIFDRIANTLGHLQETSKNIGGYFTERKLNNIHSKALKEYSSDHYLDYVGHINKLAESDNEDYQTYAQPIAEHEAPRAQRKINKLHTEALKEYRSEHRDSFVEHVGKLAKSDNEQVSEYGQKQFDRENRRIGREKFFKEAKTFARATGSVALEASKGAGLVALGATMYGIDAIKETGGSLIEEAKREIEKRALPARIRRDERRTKWQNNKVKFTNRGHETIDNLKNPKAKAAIGASVIRAASLNK